MYSSKLYRTLLVINQKEWKPLDKFIVYASGRKSDAYQLYSYIHAGKHNLQHERFEIVQVTKHVFPDKSKKQIQNIMSILRKQIVKYWMYQELDESADLQDMIGFQALSKRTLYRDADQMERSISKRNEDPNSLDLWTGYFTVRTKWLRYFSNNPALLDIKMGKHMMEDLIVQMKRGYSNLVKYVIAESCNREIIYKENWSEVKHGVIPYMSDQNDLLSESLNLQLRLIESDTMEGLLPLTEILFNNEIKMSSDLRLTFYLRIRRFYLLAARTGNLSNAASLIKLITWANQNKIFVTNHNIGANQYLTEINVLLNLGEIKGAKDYFDTNKEYLAEEIRNDTLSLARMNILFFENEFHKTLRLYSQYLFTDVNFKLSGIIIFLKVSYELEVEEIELLRHIRNAQDFMSRHKKQLRTTLIDYSANFLKGYKLLLRDKKQLELLLQKNEVIRDRLWFQKKLKERER